MSISPAKIDFWIANNLNVMLIGRHGVGKTAIVTDAFNRHNLKWRYFSASTMDPWCDFIGVPKEKNENELCEQMKLVKQIAHVNPQSAISFIKQNWKLDDASSKQIVDHVLQDQGVAYLDLVRPYDFATDSVEALFFDEFNRSPKKIRNAVMELIQFKSINGRKFPNLKIVWCAINPDDDEQLKYDVETLDSAQTDRFQVSVKLPYEPNAEWFRHKYGQRLADSAILWWRDLDEASKQIVSPRRLQYAVDCFVSKGDPRDILPLSSNVSKFVASLRNGPITEIIDELIKNNNRSEAKNLLENENFYSGALPHILKSDTLQKFFLPLMPYEKIGALMVQNDKICTHIIQNIDKVAIFHKCCKETLKANIDATLVKKIRRALTTNEELAKAFAKDYIEEETEELTPTKPFYTQTHHTMWPEKLNQIKLMPHDSITQKIALYDEIAKNIPKVMNSNSANTTLAILDSIFTRPDGSGTSPTITKLLIDPNFDKISGIINHCLQVLSDLNKEKVTLQNYKSLYEAFKSCGLLKKIINN